MNDLQDVERQNFCRLALLIMDVVTDTLQGLFEKEYSATCDLQTFLNSKTHILNKLYRKKVISQSQKELLLPSNGTIPVLKTFDISLVSTLLTNLCSIAQPLNGWALAPAANDTSTGADVLRLRTARNEFYAHRAQSSMPDATFQKEWKGIVNVVLRLSMLLEIDKQNEIKDAIAEIERTDITWKREIEISKQLFQTAHCEILLKLEAIKPDKLEVINSDEVKEAANAEIPQGEDGIICVLKEYPKLKSEVPKNSAVAIAGHMFNKTLLSMDQYDKIMDPLCNRRVCIDRLLKVVVKGTAEQRECFFNNLKKEKDCSSLAIALSSRRVTEDDRNKFRQVAERYVPIGINRTTLTNSFDEKDITFFQEHLSDDLEDVDRISDELLSQFLINILEHSRITYCKDSLDMIRTLFNTMQFCHLHVESELQNRLPSALFNKWTNFRNNKCHQMALETCLPKFEKELNFENVFTLMCQKELLDQLTCRAISREGTQSRKTRLLISEIKQKGTFVYQQFKECLVLSRQSYLKSVLEVEERNLSLGTNRGEQPGDQSTSSSFLQWIHSAAMRVLEHFCEYFQMRFISAEVGSIILKFRANKDFSVVSLAQNEMEIPLEKLLRKFCFESKIKVDGSVYVTVYIVSHRDDGTEEYIQLHLDFEACHGGQREKKGNLERHERKLLVEELNPSQLLRWIVVQPNIRKDIVVDMRDIVSRKGLSRQEKMESLLKIIIKLENCREILKRFCEENDIYVYWKMFRQSDEMASPYLSYNKGGGLQKLYSMWININDDQGPVKGDSQADMGLTTKEHEKDQTEKDSLEDEGKEMKSWPVKGDSQADLGLTTKEHEKDQTEKDSLADEGKEMKSWPVKGDSQADLGLTTKEHEKDQTEKDSLADEGKEMKSWPVKGDSQADLGLTTKEHEKDQTEKDSLADEGKEMKSWPVKGDSQADLGLTTKEHEKDQTEKDSLADEGKEMKSWPVKGDSQADLGLTTKEHEKDQTEKDSLADEGKEMKSWPVKGDSQADLGLTTKEHEKDQTEKDSLADEGKEMKSYPMHWHKSNVQPTQRLSKWHALVYDEGMEKMSSMTGNVLVAAIELGTTYSRYGFSFKDDYKRNPTRVSTKGVWMKNNLTSPKTSTCVLCYPNGEFSSFGYDAEYKYAELVANDEHHKWYYFRQLRMALYEKKIQKGFEVEDEKGLKMPARKVFGMAIRYLKEDMLRTLNSQHNADYIHWILTVPAIWTDSAKQFIREAADEAGIDGDNLSIALEPGAAAIYCQLTVSDCLPSTGGYDDSKYMVIDIGGETVDITVHEKQADGTINEVHIASSGECGGNIVDEEFHQMLMKIVGNSVLLTFCERNMHDYMEMREEFERKNMVLCTNSNDKIFINVPDPLINIYEKLNGESIQNATFQYPHEGKFKWKRNKMVFDVHLFRSLFQNHISKITEFIAEIMDRPGVKGTTTFLMVGRFSDYRLIQEAVMKAFPTVKVVKPYEAELVVLKGAVILGHMICEARNESFQLQLPTNKDHSTMTTRFGPVEGDSQADLGQTTKVREKDQTEKDSLADEGKEMKSYPMHWHKSKVQPTQRLSKWHALVYDEGMEKMSSMTGNVLVAAIYLGTTYSRYGFSFKSDYKRNPTKVNTNCVWIMNNTASLKTSTCVLCYPNGEFSSFGYDAEHKYAGLVANDEHHKWYYFRRLKMALYEKKIHKGFEVEDEKGLKMPARKVFGMAIRYLKEDLLRTLNLLPEADDIHWILTVPDVWTDSAKQFIREAADEAGIDGVNLTIVLEPGAAAMYCQLTLSDCLPSTGGYDDSKYMVIDIGGETVDITVHEKQADGAITEVHIASSGECGGNVVDEEFNQMLMNIFGDSVLMTFRERNMDYYMEMREEFERKKRVLYRDSNDKIVITVPGPLINIYEKLNGKTIQNATFQSPHKGKFQWKWNKMVFDADLFRSLFQNHISKITEFIAEIMDIPGAKGTTTFLMVGEFSECQLIQQAVMKAFPTVKVVKPVEAELAVLKGAVILGHMICEERDENFQLQPSTTKDHSTMTTASDTAATFPKQSTVELPRTPLRWNRLAGHSRVSAPVTDIAATSPKQITGESKTPSSGNCILS